MSPSRNTQLLGTAAVAGLIAVTLFAGLGRPALLVPDEGRHAEIAREMLANNAFLVPKLEGRPYYDKPAPFYWLVAASMTVFGTNEMAARIPSALALLWTILVMAYFVTRNYSPTAGLLVAAGLATTVLTSALARLVIIDMTLTAALTSAFAWLGLWLLDPPPRRRPIWPFYLAIAIATLLKGPVAIVLAGLLILSCAVLFRDRFRVADLKPISGVVIVSTLVAPWYVAAWVADHDYIKTFLFLHNLQRYAVAGALRHEEPLLYYLYALPLALIPWTAAVIHALRERLLLAHDRPAPDLYLAAWAGVVVVLFFPSQAKIITYLLPAFPALLALAAAWTAERLEQGPPLPASMGMLGVVWTVLVTITLAGAGLYSAVVGHSPWPWMALALIAAATALWAARGGQPQIRALWTPALATALLFVAASGPGTVLLEETNSLVVPAEIIAAEAIPPDRVFAYRRSSHAVGFYAHSAVEKIYWAGDLAGPLASPEKAAVITKERHLLLLGLAPLPADTKIRWRNRRGDILLIKQPETTSSAPRRLSLRHPNADSWHLRTIVAVFLAIFALLALTQHQQPRDYSQSQS